MLVIVKLSQQVVDGNSTHWKLNLLEHPGGNAGDRQVVDNRSERPHDRNTMIYQEQKRQLAQRKIICHWW